MGEGEFGIIELLLKVLIGFAFSGFKISMNNIVLYQLSLTFLIFYQISSHCIIGFDFYVFTAYLCMHTDRGQRNGLGRVKTNKFLCYICLFSISFVR